MPIDERIEMLEKKIKVLEAANSKLEKHNNILCDAMSEAKAIVDGSTKQSLEAVVNGCLYEVKEFFNENR
jgi:hypothetical protein